MDTICNFYCEILRENYMEIARADSELEHLLAGSKNFLTAPSKKKLTLTSIKSESHKFLKKKTIVDTDEDGERKIIIFEKLLQEYGNIMCCLTFIST